MIWIIIFLFLLLGVFCFFLFRINYRQNILDEFDCEIEDGFEEKIVLDEFEELMYN